MPGVMRLVAGRCAALCRGMRYPDGGGPTAIERAPWDNPNTRVSHAMIALIAARDWLTVYRLPPYAHELNPAELVWSHLKRSLANLAKRNLAQRTAWSRPGSGGCSTGPACSAVSSLAPVLITAGRRDAGRVTPGLSAGRARLAECRQRLSTTPR